MFIVLYTSLFTNLSGLLSGTIGAAGYWLGQQGVQRGDQPWFYYLVLMPQYEFVAVALFPVATGWVGWRLLRSCRTGVDPDRRFLLRALLISWSLSWAGEKMLWLAVHVTLPMLLLAGSKIGEAAESIEHRRSHTDRIGRQSAVLGLGIAAAAVASFLLFAWATAGPYLEVTGHLQRTIRPELTVRWWIVYLPLLTLAVVLATGVVRLGYRQATRVLLLSGTLLLIQAQVHISWCLTYQEG